MNSYICTAGGVTTRITAPADGILRITHTKADAFPEKESAVVTLRGCLDGTLTGDENGAVFTAGRLQVRVRPDSGALSIFTADGRLLLREPDRDPHMLTEKPVVLNDFDLKHPAGDFPSFDGSRRYTKPSASRVHRIAYQGVQRFVFGDEALYGLGSFEAGVGNLRGHSRELYPHVLQDIVPVLVSTSGWGALFDMGCLLTFHDDETGSYLWADCADALDWYFFYGDGSYGGLMEQYRLLTGETPLYPRWALGYLQSKERYHSAAELLEAAEETRRRGLPMDMIVLDWQHWPEGQWGWKHLDPERFPDPEGMIRRLHELHIKFMVAIWPHASGEQNTDHREFLEGGFLLGDGNHYNPFDPAARALYWRQTNDAFFSIGADAWWCDDGQPFESDFGGELRPDPAYRAVINTEEGKLYLDPTKMNEYCLYHVGGIYENQRATDEGKRVFQLLRGSYAGQHRYGAVTWTGDTPCKWETLRYHIPEGLNFCAAGENGWTMDIGGFFPGGGKAWFLDGDFPEGAADPGFRELYVRWMQYGALLPVLRPHGTGVSRELWNVCPPDTPEYDALLKAVRLRYHLLPYLYTLLSETNRRGLPVMRHPALVFPEDRVLRAVDDQLMLGDILLAKPVSRPMYHRPGGEAISPADDGVTVYLPKGRLWYDLESGARYPGGQDITVSAPLDKIPVFLRGGAILPWGPALEYTEQPTDEPLEIRVFPGEDGSFALYEDAGDGYGYEKGEWSRIPMRWDDNARTLTLGERAGTWPGMPETKALLVRAAGLGERRVTYAGTALTLRF